MLIVIGLLLATAANAEPLLLQPQPQVQDDAEAHVDLPGRLHGVVRLLRRDQSPESIDLRLSA